MIVHPGAEGVVAERVPRGPFIKPPAVRVVADFEVVDMIMFAATLIAGDITPMRLNPALPR
jgi:hypothetical protein